MPSFGEGRKGGREGGREGGGRKEGKESPHVHAKVSYMNPSASIPSSPPLFPGGLRGWCSRVRL